jgi:plasmid stability protein
MSLKKTSFYLEDQTLKKLKIVAAVKETSVTEILKDCLNKYLASDETVREMALKELRAGQKDVDESAADLEEEDLLEDLTGRPAKL